MVALRILLVAIMIIAARSQGTKVVTMKYRVLGTTLDQKDSWLTAEEPGDNHMIPTIFTKPGETLQIRCSAPQGKEVGIDWSTNALWRTNLENVRQKRKRS